MGQAAARRRTPAGLARETALLAKHRTAWLGPLAPELVIADTVWERGFPVATKTKLAKVHQAEASLVRPEWATFERITFGGAALITETMRALEEVRALTVAGALRLGKLAAPPPRLRAIGLDIEYTDKPLAAHPAIRAVLAVPTLRALAVHVRWEDMTAAQLVELCAAAGERLEQLVLTGLHFGSAEAIASVLAKAAAHDLRAFGWGFTAALHAIARRDHGGAWTTLEVVCGPKLVPPTWRESAETLVTGLADRRFDAVTVTGDAAAADRATVAAIVGRVGKR
ncbi:MAG TPA: hypothetical protein VFQ65_32110 [Kofleriaceae bacterium]|nr:hypothetical protein [Kofleriaceae bacterium]